MGLNGEVLKSASLNLFCLQQKVSSLTTCKKWVQHYTIFGHINPKRATGNHCVERELLGECLVHYAVYWMVYLKATIDKVRAYLFNLQAPDNQQPPFSQSQVACIGKLLQLLQKVGITTCNCSYFLIDQKKRNLFHMGRTIWDCQHKN